MTIALLVFLTWLLGLPISAYVIPRITGYRADGAWAVIWPIMLFFVGPLVLIGKLSELGQKHHEEAKNEKKEISALENS